MKKLTNYAPGARGVTMKSGDVVWIKPGETVEVDASEVASMPDLGEKPAAERDADADALTTLTDENAALKAQVAELKAALEKAAKPAAK